MFRGEVPFRNKPTDRQRVITERYAEYVRRETGKVVDPEIIRAVRFTVLKYSERAIFDNSRELEFLTERTLLRRRRQNALDMLKETEKELEESLAIFDDELQSWTLPELRAQAKDLGIPGYRGMRKPELISAIRSVELDDENFLGSDHA